MKSVKKTMRVLICLLLLSGGLLNLQPMGVISAAGSSTVTFNSTETDPGVWDDGIAEDGDGGSSDIPGLTLQMYNISDTDGALIQKTLVHGDSYATDGFNALSSYDASFQDFGWKGMGIKSSGGAEFQINGFFYSNWGEGSPITITVDGFRDNVKVATTSFQTDMSVNGFVSKNVTLNEDFDNVDKVLFYSSSTSWHGINNIVIDSAVVPVPITDFANTAKTSNSASFGWTAASGATGVVIQQSPAGANTWTTATTGAIANIAGTATVTGLSPTVSYDFRLVVTGGANAGNSNTVSVTTNAAPITNFANTAKTSASASFSWTAASGASGVMIQQSPAGANTWATATTGVIVANAGTATVTGLSAASSYDFRLVVTGGVNAGNSNTVSAVTDSEPITDFANTAKTSASASFSWTPASGATGVIIQQSPAGANTWATATTSGNLNNAGTATVTGLSAASSYDFRLVVTGGVNAGNSNTVSATTDTAPITNFANTAKTSNSAAFSWTAASGATGVIIQQSPVGANTWATATTGGISNNAGTATVTGLSAAISYDFRLVVTGGVNAGNSNTVSAVTDSEPITDFANTAKTSASASFSWTPASGATGVIIQQSPVGANTWATATTSGNLNNAGTATVTGLSAATSYDFRLVVTGGVNAGNSNTVSATTDTAPITDFANTAKTITSASFSWTAASGATGGVLIQQSLAGANTWTTATTGGIANNAGTATVTGLSAATSYDFRLVVTGGVNAGNSNTVSATTDLALTYKVATITDQTATALIQGYNSGTQETKTINVTNTGTGNLTNLSAELSGTNADDFVITQPASSLNSGAPATSFTIKAKDGLVAGTYMATVTVSSDIMADVTFTVTQAVNLPDAPANPQNLVSNGGDQQVALNWNTVTGATYYNLYMSTTPGLFSTTPDATVTQTTYNFPNMINGTTYYFTVKAGNLGGLSAESNSVSATPATLPSAPTNVTAVAGNGQAIISFTASAETGGSVITGYEVTSSPGNVVMTGTSSPITISGLTNGTSYSFTVKAINRVGSSTSSGASNIIIPLSPTGGSTEPVPTTPPQTGTGVDVLVNGKVENAGTSTTSIQNNQTVTTISIDQKKLDDKLAAEGQGAVVTIPVNAKTDIVIGELNGQMIKNMENKQAVIEIKVDHATYTLPAQQINIDSLSNQFGRSVALQDIKIQIEIAVPTEETLKKVADAANKGSFTLVAPTIDFTVIATNAGKTVEVTKFNAYVERLIAIPDGVDPNKITTGVVVEPDGTVRHVPTKVVAINGKYFAKVNSLTNSTYSVVWHPLEFSDVANHWAKDAVNDMGSRMVIEGTGNSIFSPNQDITRAEFAAIIVRGLGLKLESGESVFSDVKAADWYSSAINTAHAYHLIDGFEDGSFRPNDKITREQAMVIIAKAMAITNLKAKLSTQSTEVTLRPYKDTVEVSSWALNSIVDSVQAGIVSGRSSTELAPKDYMTRAEVAAIVERLLQESGLI